MTDHKKLAERHEEDAETCRAEAEQPDHYPDDVRNFLLAAQVHASLAISHRLAVVARDLRPTYISGPR